MYYNENPLNTDHGGEKAHTINDNASSPSVGAATATQHKDAANAAAKTRPGLAAIQFAFCNGLKFVMLITV